MTDDERAIREMVGTWFAATRDGDVDTVLGLMADDVVFMVPGQEPFGKRAFEEASRMMGDARIEGSSEIVEVQVLGDWAYMRTRIEVSVQRNEESDPVSKSGYTLTILRKEQDGKWRVARDANLLMDERHARR